MKKIDWYDDFVNLKHVPLKDELICVYYFEPEKGITVKEAVGRIASESSVGTWTTLDKMPENTEKLKAHAFEINGNYVKIAYPFELWEKGNIPQLLSGIAGNIFGMKALKNLRLIDVIFPDSYINYFKGPSKGIDGIRNILNVKKRPITGAVPKPKIGFSAKQHSEIGYETWIGGFDFVKDDENLTSLSFNKFEDRVKNMAKMRDKAENFTGETKEALLNITSETNTMIKRAKLLHEFGFRFAMIDVVTCGFSGLQTMRDICEDYDLAIHAHRAMHAAFDRNSKHGITMYFLAKIMRLIGIDEIHVGTGVGKLVGTQKEVKDIADMLRKDFGNLKPVMPVSSGGLHPGLIPDIMDLFGNDCTILVSGGIHGHPKGTTSGATAVMQAIESYMDGISLEDAAKKHIELRQALDKWGVLKPR